MRQAVGIRNRIILFVRYHGEGDAELLAKVLRIAGIILGNPEDRHSVTGVTLMNPFQKRKRELADGAGDFEERRHHGSPFQQGTEQIVLSIESFEPEIGCSVPNCKFSHRIFRPHPARDSPQQSHKQSLAQSKILGHLQHRALQ